jgi:hypothetical protein
MVVVVVVHLAFLLVFVLFGRMINSFLKYG